MHDDKRIVPWVDADEFKDVAKRVSSSDDHDLHLAWKSLKLWLCRMPVSKIPRSIICTYELLNAYFEQSSQSMALALMRFVSLVSSESQDRERPNFAIPVLSLARIAGLPGWLADLRNDIAHGTIPSTDMLQTAFRWSLSYLGRFWMLNVKHNVELTVELVQALSCNKAVIFSYVEDLLHGRDTTTVPNLKDVLNSRLLSTCLSSVTECICKYGCDNLASGCSMDSVIQMQILQLQPLLDILLSHKLIGELVLQFILGLRQDGSSNMDIRLLWCVAWVEAIEQHASRSSILRSYVDGIIFDWRLAFSHVLDCLCNKFEGLIMKLLLIRDPPLSQDKLGILKDHINAFYGREVFIAHHNLRPGTRFEWSWKHAESLLWAETPLGALITLHASTSGQHKGVPSNDTESGRQIC